MKYLSLVAVGLLIAGCVEADTPHKFVSEVIAEGSYTIRRIVDTENSVVCYETMHGISCVKL